MTTESDTVFDSGRLLVRGVRKEEGFYWINRGENCPWEIVELCNHSENGWYIKRFEKATIRLRTAGVWEDVKRWKWGHKIRNRVETDEALMDALDDAELRCSMYEQKYKDAIASQY